MALLEVIDDAMSPPVIHLAQSLPELYSAVAVVGYPLGGDNICVTRGVVSRLDAMAYGGEGAAALAGRPDRRRRQQRHERRPCFR